MYPVELQVEGVLAAEHLDKFVQMVIPAVDMAHFQPNKENARAMQDIMVWTVHTTVTRQSHVLDTDSVLRLVGVTAILVMLVIDVNIAVTRHGIAMEMDDVV